MIPWHLRLHFHTQKFFMIFSTALFVRTRHIFWICFVLHSVNFCSPLPNIILLWIRQNLVSCDNLLVICIFEKKECILIRFFFSNSIELLYVWNSNSAIFEYVFKILLVLCRTKSGNRGPIISAITGILLFLTTFVLYKRWSGCNSMQTK